MKQIERRRHIVDRIKAGQTQVEVARDLGVTRQAISAMWKKYEDMGEDFFKAKSRGRYKERDQLTDEEKKRAVDWLDTHEPSDLGIDADHWDLYGTKRVVLHLTGKRVNLERAYEVFHASSRSTKGRMIGEEPEFEVEPAPERAPVSEPVSGTIENEDVGLPSLEEMERMNEETWKSIPWESPVRDAGPRVRTGKHAKGKRAPVKKKRKKRK
ncbi:MAG: helix-turn-helix domain-containing protein [Opitutales bacterium]